MGQFLEIFIPNIFLMFCMQTVLFISSVIWRMLLIAAIAAIIRISNDLSAEEDDARSEIQKELNYFQKRLFDEDFARLEKQDFLYQRNISDREFLAYASALRFCIRLLKDIF